MSSEFDLPDPLDYESMIAFSRNVYDSVAVHYEERADSMHLTINRSRIERSAEVLGRRGRVLEVGCGVGLGVRMMADLGFDVVGVDISAVSLQYAARRNPESRLLNADIMTLTTVDLGTFDWVSAQGFLHVFPRSEARRILEHLRTFMGVGSILSFSTTLSVNGTSEGWKPKDRYPGSPIRFRTEWSDKDLIADVLGLGMVILDDYRLLGEDGRTWISLTVR